MERIECEIDEVEIENESGREVPGIEATCSACNHKTESYGTGPASIRRCLALMREECPEGEENYYVADDE